MQNKKRQCLVYAFRWICYYIYRIFRNLLITQIKGRKHKYEKFKEMDLSVHADPMQDAVLWRQNPGVQKQSPLQLLRRDQER